MQEIYLQIVKIMKICSFCVKACSETYIEPTVLSKGCRSENKAHRAFIPKQQPALPEKQQSPWRGNLAN